jgi:hypothetical protein
MRNLFTLLFFSITIFITTVLLTEDSSVKREYRYQSTFKFGGIQVTNNLKMNYNAYKQHVLVLKTEQWINYTYGKDAQYSIEDSKIIIKNQNYTLLLTFYDNRFKYKYTNKITKQKGQEVISNLIQYIETCILEDENNKK